MLRWLYPITCEICGRESERCICGDCLRRLPRQTSPVCVRCGRSLETHEQTGEDCPFCSGTRNGWALARQALDETEEVMELIYGLKYRRQPGLAAALAPLYVELLENNSQLREFTDWHIVPVPAIENKIYKRGYNQAELLARALSKLTGYPLFPVLRREDVPSKTQTRLSAAQRRKNANSSFFLTKKAEGLATAPAHLLLVDDIFTTGATSRACARALRRLPGVQTVAALALVRIR